MSKSVVLKVTLTSTNILSEFGKQVIEGAIKSGALESCLASRIALNKFSVLDEVNKGISIYVAAESGNADTLEKPLFESWRRILWV